MYKYYFLKYGCKMSLNSTYQDGQKIRIFFILMLFSFVSHEVLHIMQDNERSSVMKSCRILCKNIVLLRSELDKCIVYLMFIPNAWMN